MQFVWVFVLLAGCNQIYGLDETMTEPGCIDILEQDDFDAPAVEPCGRGFDYPTNGVVRANGVVSLQPAGGTKSDASCTWPGFPFEDGAFIELVQTLGNGGTYTVLRVDFDSTLIGSIGVTHENGNRFVEVADATQKIATLGYNPERMRWLRLKPAGDQINAQYAPDGRDWTTMAVIPRAPPTSVGASIVAGNYNPLASPGTAIFDNFNFCPR